ncbi:MAG TPA: hypothetical protein VFU76_12360 [Terriglobales bacterium]|nr:hypothetical protein [Terriglobales bacterium]
MNRSRLLIVGISTVTGASFAVLAGMSAAAAATPVRRFQPFSVVITIVAIVLGYMAFRAALAGNTGGRALVDSLRAGMLGAFVALLAMFLFLVAFKSSTQGFLAHALGKPTSAFTINRLLVVSVLLGFGTGFVIRVPKGAEPVGRHR